MRQSNFVWRDPQDWSVSTMEILEVVHDGSSKKREDKKDP